jgi:hypothetical protein
LFFKSQNEILIGIYLVSDDSDYTSDVSYPINSQANVNYPVPSMSQSNAISSINENSSPLITTKKPLAFVQPVIRDPSRRLNSDQIDKSNSSIHQEPLSYISQPRKMTTQLSHDQS